MGYVFVGMVVLVGFVFGLWSWVAGDPFLVFLILIPMGECIQKLGTY